jgi:tetratricopeptide (TPR) repeat protein
VGLFLGSWVRRFGRWSWAILGAAGLVLVLPAFLTSLRDLQNTRSWGPHAWVRGVLAQLPPRSLLLTQSDDLSAGVAFAGVVEGSRPDVISIPAQHLHLFAEVPRVPRPELGVLRQALAAASSEQDRIAAALAVWPAPWALEHPGAGLFQGLAPRPALGPLPLGLGGPGLAKGAGFEEPVEEQIRGWLGRLPSVEDRWRLADAATHRARAEVLDQGAPALPFASGILRLVLEEVREDHAGALVTLGALWDRQGQPGPAIALTRQALEIEPYRPVALENLALYLSRQPETRGEALELARVATTLRPWRREAWQALARVLEQSKDLTQAAEARQRALDTPDR